MSEQGGEQGVLEGVAQTHPSTLHMDGTSPVTVKVRATTDELRALHGKRVCLVVIDEHPTTSEQGGSHE